MKKVFIDINRCTGCLACSAACHYTHSDYRSTVNFAEQRNEMSYPFICRHCEEPACLASCPRDAIKKLENGTIKRMNLLCIGCGSCALACPFGVIEPEIRGGIISKCDNCAGRTEEGKGPACVLACPAGALTFEDVEDTDGKQPLLGGMIKGRQPSAGRK
jgi:anaerobic carbon-monoxide dehydrogenase iron sulfur subunit